MMYSIWVRYHNDQNSVLKQVTGMLVKGKYKLVYYSGDQDELGADGKLIQLFDIESDPEELYDLSISEKEIAAELLNILKAKFAEVNEPELQTPCVIMPQPYKNPNNVCGGEQADMIRVIEVES